MITIFTYFAYFKYRDAFREITDWRPTDCVQRSWTCSRTLTLKHQWPGTMIRLPLYGFNEPLWRFQSLSFTFYNA